MTTMTTNHPTWFDHYSRIRLLAAAVLIALIAAAGVGFHTSHPGVNPLPWMAAATAPAVVLVVAAATVGAQS